MTEKLRNNRYAWYRLVMRRDKFNILKRVISHPIQKKILVKEGDRSYR